MEFVHGFLPWVLYWVLIGNVPLRVAVCVALAVAVGTQVVCRLRRRSLRSLDVGSLVVFIVLALAAFVLDDAVLERWLQPLSNFGIFLVALVGLVVGRPFVREYAADAVDALTARSDGFRAVTTAMTWLWVGVFAAMTVLAMIPPLVDGAATIRDDGGLLSVLCYWVLPFVLLGLAGLVSGVFPTWFEKRSALVEQRETEGLLALPPGRVPDRGWPAVACFGGSEGGFESQVGHGKLLASRGFAALAVSWVDAGAPVVAVPLERFGTAFRFLADHAEVDADRLAGMAVSRGADGLLSAVCAPEGPRCRGLVLVSPSSVTWQATGFDGEIPENPSWTLAGRAVPWLPVRSGALMPQLVRNAWGAARDAEAHRPTLLRLRPAYESGLRGPTTGAADARIPAERADCPLLLVTGTEDAVWPSGPMAQEVLGRRLSPADEHT